MVDNKPTIEGPSSTDARMQMLVSFRKEKILIPMTICLWSDLSDARSIPTGQIQTKSQQGVEVSSSTDGWGIRFTIANHLKAKRGRGKKKKKSKQLRAGKLCEKQRCPLLSPSSSPQSSGLHMSPLVTHFKLNTIRWWFIRFIRGPVLWKLDCGSCRVFKNLTPSQGFNSPLLPCIWGPNPTWWRGCKNSQFSPLLMMTKPPPALQGPPAPPGCREETWD